MLSKCTMTVHEQICHNLIIGLKLRYVFTNRFYYTSDTRSGYLMRWS